MPAFLFSLNCNLLEGYFPRIFIMYCIVSQLLGVFQVLQILVDAFVSIEVDTCYLGFLKGLELNHKYMFMRLSRGERERRGDLFHSMTAEVNVREISVLCSCCTCKACAFITLFLVDLNASLPPDVRWKIIRVERESSLELPW